MRGGAPSGAGQLAATGDRPDNRRREPVGGDLPYDWRSPGPVAPESATVLSSRYLLTCSSCGASVAVGPSQAGGVVHCECGAPLDVPRLGELRSLPSEHTTSAAHRRGGWNARLGVLTAGLIAAAVLAAGAGWLMLTAPTPTPAPDPTSIAEDFDKQIEQMRPVDLWRMQTFVYDPLARRGLEKIESPVDRELELRIQQSRFFSTLLSIAAGVCLVVVCVAMLAMPKA